MKTKEIFLLFGRYTFLTIIGSFGLGFIYKVFTLLTIYPVNWVLNSFYNAYIIKGFDSIYFEGIYLDILPACVAGSAYYLLLILNLTTPMKIKKRVKNLLFLWMLFLVINITRIASFTMLFYSGLKYFNTLHEAFWYFGSTIMIIGIWFFGANLFKIKEIPIYTDAKNIFKADE